MKKRMSAILLGAALAAAGPPATAGGVKIIEPAAGVKEFDLFSPDARAQYVKSVDVRTLKFPIPVVMDRELGFIIRLEGTEYFVGASDVQTDKPFDTSATCGNAMAPGTGASRGITGKGCR